MDKLQYQKENDELLQFILDERFFKPWKDYKEGRENTNESIAADSGIEIYITSTCNQHCEYCYLINNPEIYPTEFNNKELILKNLRILLDWILENEFHIPTYNLFSGEIWHTEFGLEVLNILYEYYEKGLYLDFIMIPSNCSFLLDKTQTVKIQNLINKFNKVGIRLCFSISVDGKVIESKSRPLNLNKEKDEEFYENMFMFAKHNDFKFHPMISSFNIPFWEENYLWWEEECKKYEMNLYDSLMMLEVRNDDWTEKTITQYNSFMKFLIDKHLIHCKNDIKNFTYQIFSLIPNDSSSYVPYFISEADNFNGCSVAEDLTIRLGDLAICPCHRTAYKELLYGNFIIENNHIVSIQSNNVYNAIRILMANNKMVHVECDTCIFNDYCLHGCFGSQYEANEDCFINNKTVCNFFESKWKFIISYYEELGVFDILKEISVYNKDYLRIQKVLNFYKEVKNVE